MKFVLLAALAAGTLMTATVPADAAQGCGPGFHRGPYGRCFPNGRGYGRGYGPGGPVLVVGNFYPGRGYWDGHRYYHNRFRNGGGWRYR